MIIANIVCEMIAHAICHSVYPSVHGMAILRTPGSFRVEMENGKKFDVDMTPDTVFIMTCKSNPKLLKDFKWSPCLTVDQLAAIIVDMLDRL